MEIKTDDYTIWRDAESATVHIQGILRLSGMKEYDPIMEFMLEALGGAEQFTLNLQGLEFLNSSGISMLTMFVIKVRQQGNVKLQIQGSETTLWQTKSLKNLKRLMPSLSLEFA
ncbi:hypothetical protein C1752_06600 [Acaryochloris thomasi RCC1774]|uniref:STAS domain-containing protein n=1 Tax=Acaryochloris thomasi RCC1774 TaxID=1764569 RepID=A0A2W1JQ04_9CYAN|nr:hypothetical protein [Acaryochloris thomasi]PZD71321.1 hypothetical protein C1752_06600 [Acaryochloris thomasi RCC1774]